jgi:uncharacterized protein GlcG (DUF336 family)
MSIVIKAGTAVSTAANTKSADQVSGTYQFVGKGKITVVAKGSATGMNVTCLVGGVAIVNDEAVPFTGTAGTISTQDNVVASQVMNGGRVEFYLRNTTGGALTTDYILYFEPIGGR